MICLFGHKWYGCKCLKCGQTREHNWCGCKCKNCGTIRDEGHCWNGSICSACGQERNIDEIYDHAILVDIAKNDRNIYARIKAAEKLNDKSLISYLKEVCIAERAKRSRDWDDYYAVKKKITDQALLADIAKNATHLLARKFAAEMLTDQAALAEILKSSAGIAKGRPGAAGKDIYFDVREAAAQNLTDKTLIADVLENAEHSRFNVLFKRLEKR